MNAVQRQYDRIARGLCRNCGCRPLTPGLTSCEVCLQRQRLTMADMRQDRRERGVCYHCPRKVSPGKTMCGKCLQRGRANRVKQRLAAKASGKCSSCGVRKAKKGRVTCVVCIAAATRRKIRNKPS